MSDEYTDNKINTIHLNISQNVMDIMYNDNEISIQNIIQYRNTSNYIKHHGSTLTLSATIKIRK